VGASRNQAHPPLAVNPAGTRTFASGTARSPLDIGHLTAPFDQPLGQAARLSHYQETRGFPSPLRKGFGFDQNRRAWEKKIEVGYLSYAVMVPHELVKNNTVF